MIYDFPATSEQIRQGDIFVDVPRVEFDLSGDLSVLEENMAISSVSWEELVREKKDVAAVLGITLVPAVVATQSCDTQRSEYITLCEIIELTDLGPFKQYSEMRTKSRVSALVKNERKMHNYFYLPPDNIIGFEVPKAILFPHTMRLARNVLEAIKENRKGRLNETAFEHFREKFSNYYRRYAFNEWYMLNKDELKEYEHFSELTSNQLYPWHK